MQDSLLTDFEDSVLREINYEPLRVDFYGYFQSKARLAQCFSDQNALEQALVKLAQQDYIQEIDEKHHNGAHWQGYKLTPLGRSYLARAAAGVTYSFQNIDKSNIAVHSAGSKLNINASELSDDIQQRLLEIKEAMDKKNPKALKKAFAYLADKSIDVAIALLTQGVKF